VFVRARSLRLLQVIDPPFITREVWEKYSATAKFLLAEGGRLICTTIQENAAMMNELLQARAVVLLYFHLLRSTGQATKVSTVHPAPCLSVSPRSNPNVNGSARVTSSAQI
jgi:hypothetical protein